MILWKATSDSFQPLVPLLISEQREPFLVLSATTSTCGTMKQCLTFYLKLDDWFYAFCQIS